MTDGDPIGLKAVLDDSQFSEGLKRYLAGLDRMAAGGDDAAAAAKLQDIALVNLAKTMADPTGAKVAIAALDRLEQQFKEGKISAEKYAQGTQAIQEGFGIITDESKAMAGTLLKLEESFNSGDLSAEDYAKELRALTIAEEEAAAAAKKLAKEEDTAAKELKEAAEAANQAAIAQAARIEVMEKAFAQAGDLIRGGLGLAELGANFDRQKMRFEAFAKEAGGAAALSTRWRP